MNRVHDLPKCWEDDPLFLQTKFLVRATHEETHGIWYKWSHVWGLEMDQVMRGWRPRIGELARHAVHAEVEWFVVLGEPVAFVDASSTVVDYAMLAEWTDATFRNVRVQSDAANFGNVLSAIERYTGRAASLRDMKQIDRALAALPLIFRGTLE